MYLKPVLQYRSGANTPGVVMNGTRKIRQNFANFLQALLTVRQHLPVHRTFDGKFCSSSNGYNGIHGCTDFIAEFAHIHKAFTDFQLY
jgi:hypothetical protein